MIFRWLFFKCSVPLKEIYFSEPSNETSCVENTTIEIDPTATTMASDENGNIAESMNGNDCPTTSDIQSTSISNQGTDIFSWRNHFKLLQNGQFE